MRIKLLHCGDLHLDAPFTSLAEEEGMPAQRRRELKQVLVRIVELAAAERADLLLVCGDLYEHGYASRQTLHFICDQFHKIPDIPVLLIPGNHDPAVSGSLYREFSTPVNMHILSDQNPVYMHPKTGARVSTLRKTAGGLDRSVINILMHHGTLDMPFSKEAFQPVHSVKLEGEGYDYCALGHFHTRIHGAGVSHRIYNAGSPEPLGFDEEGEHGVVIAEIEKLPGEQPVIHANFAQMNSRRFITLNVDVSECRHSGEMASRTLEACEAAGNGADLFRVELTGYLPPAVRPDPDLIRDFLSGRIHCIRINDKTVPDYNFEQIGKEPGLRGLFTQKMLERVRLAADPEEKRLVLQALYYGMDAIGEGRVCI